MALSRFGITAALATIIATASIARASGQNLIANGDFETGTLSGWSEADQASPYAGGFSASNDIASPINGLPSIGPAAGAYYAVSDQTGPGAHVLYQSFSVPTNSQVFLSFDMFVNNWFDQTVVDPSGLDWTSGGTLNPNQHARVDILADGFDPFDTGAGVLGNFYLGADGPNLPNLYTHYFFNITGLTGAGGTFLLRFGEVDNQFPLNQGIDNVMILAVPEPGALAAAAAALCACVLIVRPRRKSPPGV